MELLVCEINETMMSDLAASSELSAVHNVNSSCIDNAGKMLLTLFLANVCQNIDRLQSLCLFRIYTFERHDCDEI